MGGVLSVILQRGSILDIIASVISAAIVVFLTLPIHEYAHGFAATKLGDPTPRFQGRMTLNPLAHLDYFGSLMIFLVGFGWAKPVGVNPRYFKNAKVGMAITAFAGPLSNILVAFAAMFLRSLFIFIVLAAELNINAVVYFISNIFSGIAIINVSLAVFNLVPIPPLDGSKILAVVLPDKTYYRLMQYERYFSLIILMLLVAGSAFSNILGSITYATVNGINTVTWLPFELILNAMNGGI